MRKIWQSSLVETGTARDGPSPLLSLEVRVDSFNILQNHVEYAVSVKTRISAYTVLKRYSQFYQLDQTLRKCHSEKAWPVLPERLVFGNKDPQKLEARRTKLFEYLATAVAIYAREPSIKEVGEFIELQPEEARKLMDVNAANLYLNNKCMVAYLGLVYTRGDIRKPLAEFLGAAMRARVPQPVAQAILSGEGAVQSIFTYSFCSPVFEPTNLPPSLFSVDSIELVKASPSHTAENSPHFRCAIMGAAILALFDLVACLNAPAFRATLRTLRINTWLGGFQEHVQSPASTACKANCYRLIRLFLELNNFFDVTEVFTSPAERDRFFFWMKMNTPRSAELREQEVLQTPFPKLESVIRDGLVAVEFLQSTLKRFNQKGNLNTVIHNMDIHFSRFSFLINESHLEEFVQTMQEFRWSPNKIQIRSERGENSSPHFYDRMIYFHRRNSRVIISNVWMIYRVKAGEKTLVVFFTEEPTPQLQQEYYDRFLEENPRARKSHITVSENNTGVFLEIDPFPEDPSKLLVSVLIVFGFRPVTGEAYYNHFRSMARIVKNIKTYYDAFVARESQCREV